MNKIVCNLCGTSYPDTASQCPICGTAKADTNKSTAGSEGGYAFVKGGRFSKANVRKRNAGQKDLPRVVAPVKQEATAAKPVKKTAPETAPEKKKPAKPQNEEQESRGSNFLLALIALLLVVAIIAVCAYIVKEYFLDDGPVVPNNGTNQTTTAPVDRGPCTGLTLPVTSHTFTAPGETFMLSPKPVPANTTDTFRYESSDESVVTVSQSGVVTAVADGTATIFVYCGDQMVQFAVTCEVGVEPGTQPTEPSVPDVVLELNRTEFTLSGYGATYDLYDGELDVTTILWTSSNEAVATVKDGVVMAVGNGNAVITAEYMGQSVTCKVVCTDVVVSDYELRTRYGMGDDFTISVGDMIELYLIDKVTGLRIQAENLSFAVSRDGVITINEKGKITAVGTGTVTVTVTYGDLTFKSIVRVPR